MTGRYEWSLDDGRLRALFTCGSCNEGIIFEWAGGPSVVQKSGDLEKRGLILGRQWPEEQSGDAPSDTPASVANFFQQGTASLNAGHFDAAGMMFRKSLESATKALKPELSGKNLVARIDALVAARELTEDLGVWAHEVRLGGNEAAHEDEPFSIEQAEDLRNFIENFLRYAFTLPSAVRRRSTPEAAA